MNQEGKSGRSAPGKDYPPACASPSRDGNRHPRQIDPQDGFSFSSPCLSVRTLARGNKRDDTSDVRRCLDGLRVDKLRDVRHALRFQRDKSVDGPGGPTQEAMPQANDFDPIIGDPPCTALRETQRTGGLSAAAIADEQEP
ncbi:MAG: hypothetical protein WCX34_10690, partial [Syntrophales bacterium]